MRSKVIKEQGNLYLQYSSTYENPLDMNVVQQLSQSMPAGLMSFEIVQLPSGLSDLRYDITRLVTLTARLNQIKNENDIRQMFGQFKQVIDACVRHKLLLKNLELAYNSVYYDSWSGALRFVYLPLLGIAPDVQKIRDFFAVLPSQIQPPDAPSAQLLMEYSAFFAKGPQFNPLGFAEFLGGLSSPTTQVDWATVKENQTLRKADTPTTQIAAPDDRPTGPVGQVTEEVIFPSSNEKTGGPVGQMGNVAQQVSDAPPTNQPFKQAAVSGRATEPENGAHARVDPGTTVLGALSFDFSENREDEREDTAILGNGSHAGLDSEGNSADYSATSSLQVDAMQFGKTPTAEAAVEIAEDKMPSIEISPAKAPVSEKGASIAAQEAFVSTSSADSAKDVSEEPLLKKETLKPEQSERQDGEASTRYEGKFPTPQVSQDPPHEEPVQNERAHEVETEPKPQFRQASNEAEEPKDESRPSGSNGDLRETRRSVHREPREQDRGGNHEEARKEPHREVREKTFWLRRRSTDERVQIQGDRFVVGKSKYSTFQVRHTTTVSRSHAIFTVEGGECWMEDDGSRNGTYIDNRRIEPYDRQRLHDGMVIRMSDEEFEFSEE